MNNRKQQTDTKTSKDDCSLALAPAEEVPDPPELQRKGRKGRAKRATDEEEVDAMPSTAEMRERSRDVVAGDQSEDDKDNDDEVLKMKDLEPNNSVVVPSIMVAPTSPNENL